MCIRDRFKVIRSPMEALKKYFGFSGLREGQDQVEMCIRDRLYASWAFFPRSAFSTAFHRVWWSAYSGGAWDGRRMSEQITPPLRV